MTVDREKAKAAYDKIVAARDNPQQLQAAALKHEEGQLTADPHTIWAIFIITT